VVEDVVYRPLRGPAVDDDPDWGVYDRAGRLLEAAAYYRGPSRGLVGQSLVRAGSDGRREQRSFVYGGVLFDHFGHFVLSSLARLWPFADPFLRASLEGFPILFHAASEPASWFEQPFVAELLTGLGLGPERFVRFGAPVRVGRLIVPGPSVVEMSHVHPAFVQMTRTIGAALGGDAAPDRGGPVWLSRTRLPVGTQGWGNEDSLEAVLRPLGVEVVYPEARSIADRIRLFAGRPVIAGTVASAFYVSLFCERPAPMVLLSPSPIVNPSFGMLDEVAGQSARYFYVESDHLGIDMSRRLWSTFMLRDPEGIAGEVLRLMRELS
jgi:capsular polysaccharide biosynthesis protein